ncbi:MAG: hypothetical protein H0U29_08725, partial [Acidimicrobiia bacterium]|nr:hypothetical protein [Acidimicrobiia bacterium]
AVAAAISAGRDPRVLGEEVLARLRDIFLFRMGGATEHLMADDVERVRAWSDRLSPRATTRALETMGEALAEMRQAPDPRIPLEVAMVKITRPDADASLEGLIARVATLEAALASGSVAAPPVPSAGPSTSTNPSTDPAVMLDPASRASGPPDATTADRSGPPPPSRPSRPSGRPDPTSGRPTALPSRPAPPPRPARPGDGARAQLAANRGDRATAPGHDRSVEPGSAGGPPPTSAPPVDSSAVAPGPATQAPPSDQANPTEPTIPARPAPASSPAPETPAESADGTAAELPETTSQKPAGTEEASVVADSEALPDRDEVITLWNETVLPSLGGLTKAMYAVGRITEVTASTAVLAFPNDVHRQKCQQKQAEVERALSNALGRPVELRLVVDSPGDQGDPSNAGGGERNSSSGRGGTLANDDDLDLTGADVHDLDDAPDAPAGGIDALTQAFPGSELVEGS